MNEDVEKQKAAEKAAWEESERKRIYYNPTLNNVVTDGNHSTANMPERTYNITGGPIPHHSG